MFFTVSTPEGDVAVFEPTFFAAVKRMAVHADPCAEYEAWSRTSPSEKTTVTAADCWQRLQEIHDETWGEDA